MSFKDIITSDVVDVFLGKEEFDEKHKINGVEMDVLIDKNELQRRNAGKVYTAEAAGIYKGTWLVYVPAEQYGAMPTVGSVIALDGKKRRVIDCTDEAGVYAIELEALRS